MLRLQAYPSANNISYKLSCLILWMKYGQDSQKIRWDGVLQKGKLYKFVAKNCCPVCWPSIWSSSHSTISFTLALCGFPCRRWIPMCWVLIAPWEALQKQDVGSYAWPWWRCQERQKLSEVDLLNCHGQFTWRKITHQKKNTIFIWSNYRDLTRVFTWNGGLVRQIPVFQENLGWWNIISWPDI